MVESSRVEAAMVEFAKRLTAYEEGRSLSAKQALEQAAYRVAHAIRDSLQQSWAVDDVPPL